MRRAAPKNGLVLPLQTPQLRLLKPVGNKLVLRLPPAPLNTVFATPPKVVRAKRKDAAVQLRQTFTDGLYKPVPKRDYLLTQKLNAKRHPRLHRQPQHKPAVLLL